MCDAKKSLYEIAAEKEYDDVPRNIARQGDNKKTKEVENLIAIYEYLNRKRCVLSIYVAADLNKIPIVRAADADVCTIMMQMMKIQEDIEQMRSQICCVVKACKEVDESVKDVERSISRTNYNDLKCNVDNSASMSGLLSKPEENQSYQLNTTKLSEVIKEWESND